MVQPLKRQASNEVSRPVSALQRLWEHGDFAITVQLPPLFTTQTEGFVEQVAAQSRWFDAVLVADGPDGAVTLSSLALAVLFGRAGLETIALFSGRDKNRLALQSDILSLGALQIPNLLVDMRPLDRASLLHNADARLVAELDGPALLSTAISMRDKAHFVSGASIKTPPVFYLGALISLENLPLIEEMEAAQFFVVTPSPDAPRLSDMLCSFATAHADFLRTRPLLVSLELAAGPLHEQTALSDPLDEIRMQTVITAMHILRKCDAVRGFNIIVPQIAYLAQLEYLARAATSRG